MLNSYYVLRSLAHEWRQSLAGQVVQDSWTQAAGELCIALGAGDQLSTLSFLTHAPLIGAFVKPGFGRARRNQRSVFRPLNGQEITRISIVEGERILQIETTGNFILQAYLFGPRANVYLMDARGPAIARFRTRLRGLLPSLRPVSMPDSLEEFQVRWAACRPAAPTKVLAAVMPFFDHTLAAEALMRSGLHFAEADRLEHQAAMRLYEAAMDLHHSLLDPSPRIYRDPLVLAACPLTTCTDLPTVKFTTMDAAARAFARQALAQRAFHEAFEPRQKALVARIGKAHRTVERLRKQQNSIVKEAQHRRFGDLLMAAARQPAGASLIELPDLFQGGSPVQIPLDPALNSFENAERYYTKARNIREHRRHLSARLASEEHNMRKLQQDLCLLRSAKTLKQLKALDRESDLTATSAHRSSTPFRRYRLARGYELWVGRNAMESEMLTMKYARPFDLWLHARGVSGAHAVLRLPHRQDKPAVLLLEQAAAIAAWHSKARGSAIVPVIVTPRKYVHRARGGVTGAMTVMREQDVLLVEPALP